MINHFVLLAIPQYLIVLALTGAMLAGAVLGYLFKLVLLAKKNGRILTLEDEMLSNHSRILSLEKKITQLEAEKKELINSRGFDNNGEKKTFNAERKVS
ncbi:MAG: hypothetical protein ACR2FN_06545 [Chitinophagaceae bacterium]